VYRTVGRPVAGKTGTTDDNRAVWFIGITPGLTAAGFIADPDNPFHTVRSSDHNKAREATAAMLKEVLAGTPALDFAPPPPPIVGKATGGGHSSPRRSRRV
jgi:membrane peptidoglycan carboxypeptidase